MIGIFKSRWIFSDRFGGLEEFSSHIEITLNRQIAGGNIQYDKTQKNTAARLVPNRLVHAVKRI